MTAVGAMTASGGSPASPDSGSAGPSSENSSLASQLVRLPDLDSSALREEWRRLRRSEPPRVSRDLLARAVAYGLQEREHGGLPKWARQSLASSEFEADAGTGAGTEPARSAPPLPSLKPGARLIREWHGRIQTVVVLDEAFEFEGRRYRSLTQIAREITGAHWSGPRFFGLAKRSSKLDAEGTVRPRSDEAKAVRSAGSRAMEASYD